jgi:hypothetical protein
VICPRETSSISRCFWYKYGRLYQWNKCGICCSSEWRSPNENVHTRASVLPSQNHYVMFKVPWLFKSKRFDITKPFPLGITMRNNTTAWHCFAHQFIPKHGPYLSQRFLLVFTSQHFLFQVCFEGFSKPPPRMYLWDTTRPVLLIGNCTLILWMMIIQSHKQCASRKWEPTAYVGCADHARTSRDGQSSSVCVVLHPTQFAVVDKDDHENRNPATRVEVYGAGAINARKAKEWCWLFRGMTTACNKESAYSANSSHATFSSIHHTVPNFHYVIITCCSTSRSFRPAKTWRVIKRQKILCRTGWQA